MSGGTPDISALTAGLGVSPEVERERERERESKPTAPQPPRISDYIRAAVGLFTFLD
jgi:hypothetical protein